MSNRHLNEAKQAMNRAAGQAEEARRQYNNAVKEWKAAKARYERLESVELDERLKLELARQSALADGDAVLAALLTR
jgi:hypothetical protein